MEIGKDNKRFATSHGRQFHCTREDAAEGNGFPSVLTITYFSDRIFISFGILIHQSHTKIIIIINIAIPITTINNKNS